MYVTAIIAAAGSGRRMGSPTPKQFLTIGGMTVLERTTSVFLASPRITDIVIVTPPGSEPAAVPLPRAGTRVLAVAGGSTRQESVALGFDRVREDAAYVVVHDAARPFVTTGLIARTLDAAIESGAAVAALPSPDTVKEARMVAGERVVGRTIARDTVYLAQTPQAFRRDVLAAAVARGRAGAVATDESGLVELAGHPVRLVEGDRFNLKITTAGDLALASGMLEHAAAVPVLRTGTGYDLHRLVAGRRLVVGGIEVPSETGAFGHSDADVACHAVTDAVLGAARAGDIGQHFPDTDSRWRGADSITLLREAVARVRQKGFTVENVDVVVVLERPKLGPHRAAMEARLAAALGVDVDRVSVKAKTNEGVDAIGRGEAIAAHAVALLRQTSRAAEASVAD